MMQFKAPLDIRIDKDGIWYFHDEEMKRVDIVQYLYKYLKRDSAGQYLIETENDRCYVTVDDVPYVIRNLEAGFSKNDELPCIVISLSDGSKEELNFDMPFWVGKDNVIYCRVKRGAYAARFSRAAYYQLCEYVEHDSTRDTYSITFNNCSYPLVFIDHS
jgi:uncharacterized protein